MIRRRSPGLRASSLTCTIRSKIVFSCTAYSWPLSVTGYYPDLREDLTKLEHNLDTQTITLVLSGAVDPITPAVYVEHIVERLRNGRLVRVPNGAHINTSDCVERIMLQFIKTADEAKTYIGCLEAMRFPPFKAPSAAAR